MTKIQTTIVAVACAGLSLGCSGAGDDGGGSGTTGTGGESSASSGGAGWETGAGGTSGTGGVENVGAGGTSSGGAGAGGSSSGGSGAGGTGTGGSGTDDCSATGAAESFSFFVTSWHHIQELSGSDQGFGGDLRWGGATTGLEGADAICQEIARRVCFGHKTWRAYLSTTTVDAIDRIGSGPWYDFAGALVASDPSGLITGSQTRQAGGCCDVGTYDELGVFHDGTTDVNNDSLPDDDHDVLTGTDWDGTYSGFSCNDWTSADGNDEVSCGHSWPASSGQSWSDVHNSRGCAAGVNFEQGTGGDSSTVGGGGGYGGIYCFAE